MRNHIITLAVVCMLQHALAAKALPEAQFVEAASPFEISASKPTLDGVTVCNKDHPTLKLSFGSATVHIQSSGDVGHFDCTEKYSIAYSGTAPWLEGALQLPDTICGQKLHARVKIHSSFEKLDFINGGKWGKQTTLKREMKDGIDHCGTCPCDDCHYDCSTFDGGLVAPMDDVSDASSSRRLLGTKYFNDSTIPPETLRNSQHRRRSTPPPPIPKSCTCHGESGLDTVTRRRQFQSAYKTAYKKTTAPTMTEALQTTSGEIPLVTFDGAPRSTFTFAEHDVPNGVSKGNWAVANGYGTFDGEVKPEWNTGGSPGVPGWLRVAADGTFADASSAGNGGALILEVRNTGPEYQGFHIALGTSEKWSAKKACGGGLGPYANRKCYMASFQVPPGASFQSVKVPFSSFSDKYLMDSGAQYKTCAEDSSVCPTTKELARIQRVELWASGATGKLRLDVKAITASSA